MLRPRGFRHGKNIPEYTESKISESNDPTYEGGYITLTCLLVGDSGVGKTAFLRRWIGAPFPRNHVPTLPVHYENKFVEVIDFFDSLKLEKKSVSKKQDIWEMEPPLQNIKMHVIDAAPIPRFGAMRMLTYQKAEAIILFYDITDRNSFLNIEKRHLSEIKAHRVSDEVVFLLVGTKEDLSDRKRQVSYSEGLDFSKEHNILFLETSAKKNIRVDPVFQLIIQLILSQRRKIEQNDQISRTNSHSLPSSNTRSSHSRSSRLTISNPSSGWSSSDKYLNSLSFTSLPNSPYHTTRHIRSTFSSLRGIRSNTLSNLSSTSKTLTSPHTSPRNGENSDASSKTSNISGTSVTDSLE